MSKLFYVENIFDQDQILEIINKLEFVPITSNSRKVVQFGYKYQYFSDNLEVTTPIPEELNFNKRISNILGKEVNFDQLIINKYEPGQGISPHIDNPKIFGPDINWWCMYYKVH